MAAFEVECTTAIYSGLLRMSDSLATGCGFIGFSELIEKVEATRRLGLAKSLKPDFLHTVAEYFEVENPV
ncbi:MAG: hypothetical protein N3A53_06550 [Verrucomicrobiae bacterium]|nr:hypothetical protein [Verrucomicrobiae bacterium]